ncbi:hypothetical protein [Streptomyces millisiae]|uniref:Uncharacterized protein n=1 Tax=Streptomyces millisiae TaxID=3075542 RepID=A0ABU2LMI3_9ACTN|nr:hypothetical protein [Streptomyces sp. DSM 44918]MDT0318468.1 hypothetical protein [Streptomyces sp. DSM 44918]
MPATAISEEAGPERVNAWLEAFAHGQGLGTHVLLRTGMAFFPWLECQLPESGWATIVRGALGDDLFVASADGNVLVVVFAEEYDYQGFAAHAPEGR